jgi:hypothetical protein
MVLDITGDLFTHRRQLKQLFFYDWIVSLLGSLPILGCWSRKQSGQSMA